MEIVEVVWTAVLGVAAVAPLATFGVVLVQELGRLSATDGTAKQQPGLRPGARAGAGHEVRLKSKGQTVVVRSAAAARVLQESEKLMAAADARTARQQRA